MSHLPYWSSRANSSEASFLMASVQSVASVAPSMHHRLLGNERTPADPVFLYARMKADPVSRSLIATADDETLRNEVLTTQIVLRWTDYGMPVFSLTHSLLAGLVLTEAKGVKGCDLHLPFPAFALQLPTPFWRMSWKETEEETRSADVRTAWVGQYLDSSERPALAVRLCAPPGPMLWEHVWWPKEDEAVERWLEWDAPRSVLPEIPWSELLPSDGQLARAFRRVLVNLCLYVAERGRGAPSGKQSAGRKPSGSGESEAPTPSFWVLGREVKLDREVLKSAQAWTEARGGKKAGWRLRSRFTVMGHYRWQVCGKGRADRKRIWINPFWKGQGPKFQHLYEVGKEQL